MHSDNPKARRYVGTQVRRAVVLALGMVASWPVLATTARDVSAKDLVGAVGPQPDAVIEVWEQDWTLSADGGSVYHEKQHVRLNNDRAYGEFGDPRITYNEDADTLEIIAARTKLTSGQYVDLPEYAHVLVSPDATAGWPAYAGIRQHLLVMSGLEAGCLVELEYKITSKPGTRPYLAADIRVDHKYPIQVHRFTVITPNSAKLASAVMNGKPVHTYDQGASTTTETWAFENLPGSPDEPLAAPWQTRCPRLVFSTGGDGPAWLNARMTEVNAAAKSSDLIATLAQDWTKDRSDALDKLRGLQEKLAASFNFVDFPVGWRPALPRPAPEVMETSYGLPKDAAAVLLALARAAGLNAEPGIILAEEVWNDAAPQESMVAAYVVVLPNGGIGTIWDPHEGRIVRDGHWAGHRVVALIDGIPNETQLGPFKTADDSRLMVRGKVTVKDDGTLSGELTLRATGLFTSSESLRTLDAQKSRVSTLLGRVIPDVQIDSLDVRTLGVGELEADAKIKLASPLKKVDGNYALSLAQDGPYLADVPLPLSRSARSGPVKLPAPFDERITLTIEWPAKWTTAAQPDALAAAKTDHASAEQSVAPIEHGLTIDRHTRSEVAELPAAEFLKLRDPLNELRSEHARLLLLKP